VKRKRWDQEYRTTLNDKMFPINHTSPTYSKKTKNLMKEMLKEEQDYIAQHTGEVKTYHISELKENRT
jgi:hypothetical protein